MENNTGKKPELIEQLPTIWLKFTYTVIILAAIALLFSAGYSVWDEEWTVFLYTLASSLGVLFFCAIIQLLAKIEQNTRK